MNIRIIFIPLKIKDVPNKIYMIFYKTTDNLDRLY